MEILGVGIFGALGAVLRLSLGRLLLTSLTAPFPTLVINLLGSLAAGAVLGFTSESLTPYLRTVLTVGFLGGFTTFSALSVESLKLIQSGYTGIGALYALGSPIAGVALAALGYGLTRKYF